MWSRAWGSYDSQAHLSFGGNMSQQKIETLVGQDSEFGSCLALVIWSVSGEQPRYYYNGYEGENGNK